MGEETEQKVGCTVCTGPRDCGCTTSPAACVAGACDCVPTCPCRQKPSPLNSCSPWMLFIILWLLWGGTLIGLFFADDPPGWSWAALFLPLIIAIIISLIGVFGGSKQGVINGPIGGTGAPVPPWSGCVSWIPILVLIPTLVLIIFVIFTSGDDGSPDAVSTVVDGSTDVRPPPTDADELVTATAPPATDAIIETAAPTSPPPTSTTTVPPTTIQVVVPPLPPAVITLLEGECATQDAGGRDLTADVLYQDVARASGPEASGTPPLEADPPPALEIERVGTAVGGCDGEPRLIVFASLAGPADSVQMSLALDLDASDAGDEGYVADPNGVGGIGQTAGWDMLLPVDGGAVLAFDDEFDTLDIDVRYLTQGDLALWSVPIPPTINDINVIVQTFFRNGTTEESPIAWNTATAVIDFPSADAPLG